MPRLLFVVSDIGCNDVFALKDVVPCFFKRDAMLDRIGPVLVSVPSVRIYIMSNKYNYAIRTISN